MKPSTVATIVTGAVVLLVAIIVITFKTSNPIIGVWRSETSFPFMGRVVDSVEFKSDSVYMAGMKFKAQYEVENNQVIVSDEFGIGTIYRFIDSDTMETNMMGIRTVYKRVQ